MEGILMILGIYIASLLMGITTLVYTIKRYNYTKVNPFKNNLPPTRKEREEKYLTQASLYGIYQTSFNQKQCTCDN